MEEEARISLEGVSLDTSFDGNITDEGARMEAGEEDEAEPDNLHNHFY